VVVFVVFTHGPPDEPPVMLQGIDQVVFDVLASWPMLPRQ
jgi:hypothetical protein